MNPAVSWLLRTFVASLFALALVPAHRAIAGDVFSLEERVACHALLEDLAWSKRIWPEANPQPKPARSTVISDDAIHERVVDELRMEAALASHYGLPITDAMLQVEINRMARSTRAPDDLRERFQALDNDPRRIAECMARPQLVRSHLRSAYASDEAEHDEPRERARIALAALSDTAALATSGVEDQTHVLLRRTDNAFDGASADLSPDAIELDGETFDAEATRLAGHSRTWSFDNGTMPHVSHEQENVLRETEDAFIHEQVLSLTADRIEVRSLVWAKRPFDAWWQDQQAHWPAVSKSAAASALSLPAISGEGNDKPFSGGDADTWRPGGDTAPPARHAHSAVWTGSEMIVWGGMTANNFNLLNSGGRYDPASDTWSEMTRSGAPSGRAFGATVWTGTEMIIWSGHRSAGGASSTSGGRYNPATNTWVPTSLVDVPAERSFVTAVWTGDAMLIWGGTSRSQGALSDGSLYDPASDTWTPIAASNAPDARFRHTAVWTGSEMIVWGGTDSSGGLVSGGRYSPATDTWLTTSTTGVPPARHTHTAVWTGDQMIIWGGLIASTELDSGGRYDPHTDSWTSMAAANAPTPRYNHAAAWTGSEMIILGGQQSQTPLSLGTGGRYNPTTDAWTATPQTNALTERFLHSMVWTGEEIIVWGGQNADGDQIHGARWAPSNATWTPITGFGSHPSGKAVWTGSEMIVWGERGGRFDPSTNRWSPTSVVGAPSSRAGHVAEWTGSEMVVWGGSGGGYHSTGGRYNPITDSWTATSAVGAPSARTRHSAVWTGSEMIVWGGWTGNLDVVFASGARYNPATDSWTAMSVEGVPTGRYQHTAVWTGSEMIVWGGAEWVTFATGGRYNPTTDSWTSMSTVGALTKRVGHTAVWTGSEMIVWGGTVEAVPLKQPAAATTPRTTAGQPRQP